jgi:hypothetical protein
MDASLLIPGLDDRFGLCPGCHSEGLIMPVRNGNWFACEQCGVRWRVGNGMFSRDWDGELYPAPVFDFEHEGFWLGNARRLVRFRRVVPVYLQDASGFVMPSTEELERRARLRQLDHAQAHQTLGFGAKIYDRLQFGSQVEDTDPECATCRVTAGKFHVPGCERERCPRCGRCGITTGDDLDALEAKPRGRCVCYLIELGDSEGARSENATWVPRACRYPCEGTRVP